ncbi:GNAT family N-acetyltransferase [Flagellimonas sp. S3867]|uniref:GNAT family N-acetyltransferase n=1 Tax=Flagellimonas sp. S3867 TaxID=2768063 RepID=UPI001681D461|nr:GNAT family N-acetyltransferase [Flagellimonas sp. S3867]
MNPFFHKEFTKNWLKFFATGKKPVYYKSVGPLGFIKSWAPRLYYNIGRNITNGLTYNLYKGQSDIRKKVFLVYDVIPYVAELSKEQPKNIGVKKIKQYKGYLTRFTEYKDFNDFLSGHYSSSTRMKLRKNERKLKTNFNIEYETLFGDVSKQRYENLMDYVFELIESRFKNLRLDNDILHKKEYYRKLFYDMILGKKAIIHMICHDKQPIAVSLSFLSESSLLYAINTFDTRYRRYNLGHISILNMVKWCFENNMDILDYSKGTYDYKLRWANETYCFENHIIYDKNSMLCKFIASLLFNYFSLKQYLRDKKFNETYVKFKFFWNSKRKNAEMGSAIKIEDIDEERLVEELYEKISHEQLSNLDIAGKVYDMLYSKPQSMDSVQILKHKNGLEYVVIANGIRKRIILDPKSL